MVYLLFMHHHMILVEDTNFQQSYGGVLKLWY